ncbi:cytosine deaminase [Synechococcus sp. PCC 7336]|uniref:cytosine deaminase n=1 Tax=Synechococcus sp. PCC 7336 TaxID=195250 RepID=UPI001D0D4943|nr:cytosine deaminase [Synechococcus sp. PCC 7336]
MPPFDLILRRARLQDHSVPQDIAIAAGTFAAIAPRLDATAREEIDCSDRLAIPPFVESHIHLDSADTAGEPRWNESGTLFEGIEIWRDRKQKLSIEDVEQRAIATLKTQAAQGVLHVRSHADVSESSLIALKGLLAVREEVKDWMNLQVVAFPQDGLYGSPQQLELMEEALKLGADAIGGIPHYELTREDGVRSLQQIFDWAEQYDKLIDIHCDEIDDDQSRFLEVMVAQTLRRDLGSRVTASHTTAFHSYNNGYAQKLLGSIRRTQLNCVANPLINITLQGRTDTYPKRRGVTRVKELWQQGNNVSLGHDCIRDPWYSLGTGNMLNVAHMAVHICQMTGREQVKACLDMVTHNGAKTLNLDDRYGIALGRPASLVVLDASDEFEAIRTQAAALYTLSHGRILACTPAARPKLFLPEPSPRL